MKEIIEGLIKEREELQKNLAHAIQNEKNPFSNDGELRVKRYREEIKLNSDLLEKFINKTRRGNKNGRSRGHNKFHEWTMEKYCIIKKPFIFR